MAQHDAVTLRDEEAVAALRGIVRGPLAALLDRVGLRVERRRGVEDVVVVYLREAGKITFLERTNTDVTRRRRSTERWLDAQLFDLIVMLAIVQRHVLETAEDAVLLATDAGEAIQRVFVDTIDHGEDG